MLSKAAQVVALLAGVWAAFRLVDVFTSVLARRAETTDSKLDDLLIPLVRKSAKIFIFAFGLVFIADNLGTDVTSLLAGLGLGGLAFALAAQDTVKNLFGTMTVLLDRTYNVGDWVVIGDVEGTVEHVGFRSTRVRTFYDSVRTLPNSTLITATVDNLGVRAYRRWKTHVSITYDTPAEKIEAFCEGIRELIRRHPYTRKDYFQVYLHQFSASSLDILLYVFHQAPDWSTELRERHRLMLDILRLADGLGVELAFPTQTLHLHPTDDSDPSADGGDALDDDPSAALRRGRAVARELVSAGLGDPARKPPPVKINVEEGEDRGS